MITDSEGKVISRRDFLPFGEEITPDIGARSSVAAYQLTNDNVKQKFTGYQKDDETGLDFAEARMYENRHGRFTAVDPLLASGKNRDPQTFNRYVYVLNNPLRLIDPSGLKPVYIRRQNLDGTAHWIYLDDKSKEYKTFTDKKNGYTLQKVTPGQTLISTDDRIILLKNGFIDKGPAGNATAELLVWKAEEGYVYPAPGHMAIKYTLNGETHYLSFYPTRVAGTIFELKDGVVIDPRGRFNSPEKDAKERESEPYVRIAIDKLDWKAAVEYIDKLNKDRPNWSDDRNCADVVAETLQKSGLDIQNTQDGSSTVEGVANIVRDATAKPRTYGNDATWKSNYRGGRPNVRPKPSERIPPEP